VCILTSFISGGDVAISRLCRFRISTDSVESLPSLPFSLSLREQSSDGEKREKEADNLRVTRTA